MKILRPIILLFKRARAAHFWPMIFYMLFYMFWFRILEETRRNHYYVVEMAVDRKIPFLEGFVVPYFSWFVYVAFWCVILYYCDRESYDRASTYLMIGMTIFLLVSAFLPTRQNLRLTVMPRNNVFTRMVEALWRADTPTNVSPSIHVFNTAALLLTVMKSASPVLKRTAVRIADLVWSVLICLSTMFIKQHSLFDVIMAILMVAVLAVLVNGFDVVFRFGKWDIFAARLEEEAVRSKAAEKWA